MSECKLALCASWSEAGQVQTPRFKAAVPALLASMPLYMFEARDLFTPDSPVPAPVTRQRQWPAIEAQALRARLPRPSGFSWLLLLSETPR